MPRVKKQQDTQDGTKPASRKRKGRKPQAEKRRALITGASSGLGETFARHLARRNYDLVLTARRQDRLEKLAEELSLAHGVHCEVMPADLTTLEGIVAVEKRLEGGDIDFFVNNAGFGTSGRFHHLPRDRETQQVDLNVRAVTRLAHAALSVMAQKGRGYIINVSSMAGFQPIPYMATYAASKAYILHLSEALHEEAKEFGVTVTCLCPGPVRTEFQTTAGLQAERMRGTGWTDPDFVVKAALRAAAAGRAIVVPGALNTVGQTASKLAPRFLTRKVAGALYRYASPDM